MNCSEMIDGIRLDALDKLSDRSEVGGDGMDMAGRKQEIKALGVAVGDGVHLGVKSKELADELGAKIAVAAGEDHLAWPERWC